MVRGKHCGSGMPRFEFIEFWKINISKILFSWDKNSDYLRRTFFRVKWNVGKVVGIRAYYIEARCILLIMTYPNNYLSSRS